MLPAAVFIDISVDQGGCAETTRPTTHENPTYIEEGIVHYTVANIPGAVGRTSTIALTNASAPYVRKIANKGKDILKDNEFFSAININDGEIIYQALKKQYGD